MCSNPANDASRFRDHWSLIESLLRQAVSSSEAGLVLVNAERVVNVSGDVARTKVVPQLGLGELDGDHQDIQAPPPTLGGSTRHSPGAERSRVGPGAESALTCRAERDCQGSGAVVVEGQRKDLEIIDRQEAAAVVELQCRGVAGFCLDGQADGPGGGGCGADGAQQGPRDSGPAGGGHDVQVPQLPG